MQDTLDDIFGSSPTSESDLPSLRRQHVTAGYRDGVTASKTAHVQRGFDAGFPIGAQLGMRAGTVLGILEGILQGMESRDTMESREGEGMEGGQRKMKEVRRVYKTARDELDVQSVFAHRPDTDGAPETKLQKRADEPISQWEATLLVSQWERNMDALEDRVDASR